MKTDIYSKVTNSILEQLEAGTRPWIRPWDGGPSNLPLRHNGEPYRGVNVLLLWAESAERGYHAAAWMTYRQAQALGGQVRKGERGAFVVYANTVHRTETSPLTGDEVDKSFAFLKQYYVFNVDQIDGLPAEYYPTLAAPRPELERHANAETFINATGATVQHGGARAFYSPTNDVIQLPERTAFHNADGYYGTALHELTHWTGPESRCARQFGKRFGDAQYAAEELVVEMGAAFLCAGLGITSEVREDHAQYLAAWIDVLKADRKAIFTAASAAQVACDYLHNLVESAGNTTNTAIAA